MKISDHDHREAMKGGIPHNQSVDPSPLREKPLQGRETMREIKFRAWDKKNNRMIGPWALPDFPPIDENGVITSHKKEGNQLKKTSSFMDDLIWLEYTGLKDKNGNEIYEGGIVKGIKSTQSGEDAYEIKETIQNCLGGFNLFGKPLQDFEWVDDQKIKGIWWLDHGHLNVPDMYFQITNIEVLGNIYENPELLRANLRNGDI